MLGPSLEDVRQKMQLMPTPMLMQYKSNPGQQQAGGIPMDMLAGLELSRRAQMQQQQQAAQAQGAQNQPTVVDAAAQQLGLGSLVPQGQPQQRPPMPPPQMAQAPQPQQRPPMPPPQMAQAPQPQQPPPQMAQAPQPQRLAKGGAIAFAAGERVPQTTGTDTYFEKRWDELPDYQTPAAGSMGELLTNVFTSTGDKKLDPSTGRPISFSEFRALAEQERIKRQSVPTPMPSSTPTPSRPERDSGRMSSTPTATSELEQRLIADGVTDPRQRAQMIAQLQGSTPVTYGVQGPTSGIASLAPQSSRTGPMQQNLYDVIARINKDLETPSPEMTEAEQNRIRQEEFARRQKTSAPYYQRMEELLGKERAAASQSTAGDDALMRFGLSMMGGRGNLASIIGQSGIGALDYYGKAKEKEAAAQASLRTAERLMLDARIRDERGDYEGADRAVAQARLAQQNANALRAGTMKTKLDVANIGALAEDKDERAAERILYKDRELALKEEISKARAERDWNKLALLEQKINEQRASKQTLSPETLLKLDERVRDTWPMVRSQYLDPKIMSAIEKGLSKDPAVLAAEAAAKERYKRALIPGYVPSADALLGG